MEHIDISGIDKAKLLVALYKRSKQQGLGFLAGRVELTEDDARKLLAEHHYFDYLHGKVMKISLRGNTLAPFGYDRDNGQGAAQGVVDSLRLTQSA